MSYTKGTWVDDDGSGTTGTPVTKARMDNIEKGIADAHVGTSLPLVTALPTSPAPVDGQRVLYLADESKGIVWHLRYRGLKVDGTPNPSAYKWEFVGGGSLNSQVPGGVNITTTGYAALAGSALVVPLAGDYEVHWDTFMYGTDATYRNVWLKPDVVAAGAVTDAYAIIAWLSSGAGQGTFARSVAFAGLAAGATMQLYGRNGAAGLTTVTADRVLTMRPVRVG